MATPETSASGPVKEPVFQPYVPPSAQLIELSLSAVFLGSVLGVVFGASSLYLFLKVGMTVSASIPVAVLAITIFRGLSRAFGTRSATILENNIVQTAGSAGESIAFGVGAAMPALMLLGYELEWTRVMLVAVLGGLLGILMMIPLRRAFIVKQHGSLPYPEGTACAKVLIAGEHGGSNAKTVFLGFGLGFVYQVLMQGFKLWSSELDQPITGIKGYNKAVVSLEPAPALLGVGYIIGPRIASVIVGGGMLSALLFVPMIAYFGDGLTGVLPPGQQRISAMSAGQISSQYVRYIGAGAVAAGGILSMLNALPLIFGSIRESFRALGGPKRADATTFEAENETSHPRTDRDIPMSLVLLGCLGLVAAIAVSNLIPTDTPGRIIGAVMIVLFGFLFVTVRLADHRCHWLVIEPDLGDDHRHPAADVSDLRAPGLGGTPVSPGGPVHRRRGVHRLVQRGNHLAGPEDRVPRGCHALEAASLHPGGRPGVGDRHGRHAAGAQ